MQSHDEILSDIIDQGEVTSRSLDRPELVQLQQSVSDMQSQIDERFALHSQNIAALNHQITSAKKDIKSVDKDLKEVKVQNDHHENDIVRLYELYDRHENDIVRLHELYDRHENDIVRLYELSEEHEQYTRRETLEIHGVPERPFEDTNKIALSIFRDMGVPVNRWAISRSHRQRRKGMKPSPIYVKMINHDLKDIIYERRDELRRMRNHKSTFIDENLTNYRRKLFHVVRKQIEPDMRARTYDGKIFIYIPGRAKEVLIKSHEQFHHFLDSLNDEHHYPE